MKRPTLGGQEVKDQDHTRPKVDLEAGRGIIIDQLGSSSFSNHRLRGSASTVLTATGQVNGRWRILTPHRIETHEPTATKFRTIDYVRERTP